MVFLGHISNRLLSVAHSVSRKHTVYKVVSDFHFGQRKCHCLHPKMLQKVWDSAQKLLQDIFPHCSNVCITALPWTSVQSVQIKIFNCRRRESLMLQKWTTGTPSMCHLCDGATKTRGAEYIIILETNKEDRQIGHPDMCYQDKNDRPGDDRKLRSV